MNSAPGHLLAMKGGGESRKAMEFLWIDIGATGGAGGACQQSGLGFLGDLHVDTRGAMGADDGGKTCEKFLPAVFEEGCQRARDAYFCHTKQLNDTSHVPTKQVSDFLEGIVEFRVASCGEGDKVFE